MSPKWFYSESMNTVSPCKVVPNRVVHYLVQHDFMEKMSVAIGRINLFTSCDTGIVLLDLWQAHSTGLYFSRSLCLLVISDWIECSALPVHAHTLLNMICILISQMKLQLMKRIDTDGGGFEGSPRLESRHGGFAPRTVSPRYYLASQGYLYPSLAYTEIPQVMMNLLLKSRCAGKSLYTTPAMTRIFSGCDRLSMRTMCLNSKITFSVKRRETYLTLVLPDVARMSWSCLDPQQHERVQVLIG